MKTIILSITFILLIQQCTAQSERYMVHVTSFTPPRLTAGVTLCTGTVITARHVITTATCVQIPLPQQIAITAHETLYVNGEPSNYTYTVTSAAWLVFVHPNYVNGQDRVNNVAIAASNGGFGGLSYVPRSLGGLQLKNVCNLHGWGGDTFDHRRDSVNISSPQLCQPNLPQVYCTTFDSSFNSTCEALLGSPIICGNESFVDGFLLNNRTCSTADGLIALNYHSISDFSEWIENTTQQPVPSRSSVNFVVFVAQYRPPNSLITATVRCSGTVIGPSRVLTTANCAIVELPFALSVQSRGTSSSSTSHHGAFRSGITPRSLGALQTETSCQLLGWGSHNDLTRIDSIYIVSAQFCHPDYPQIYCAIFPTSNHYSCDAMLGSPVTCGDQSILAGFLINNGSCTQRDGQFLLNYHSVSDFQRWIMMGETGSGDVKHISVLVAIIAVIINLK